MNCPNCGTELHYTDQKYCEFCGTELININETGKEEVNVKSNPTHFKRRCC
ncbi:MAG: zinc-ribbon domain-containing protein [Promethearchaeota archaeon]